VIIRSWKRTAEFIFETGKSHLSAEILEPKLFRQSDRTQLPDRSGRPGSVDKGEREKRGIRLAISSKEKVAEIAFKIRLKTHLTIEKGPDGALEEETPWITTHCPGTAGGGVTHTFYASVGEMFPAGSRAYVKFCKAFGFAAVEGGLF
jgi:hypothetical protein